MVTTASRPPMLMSFKPPAREVSKDLIPMRDFFRNPEQTNFQISPNAKYIASLRPWNNRLNIFIQPLSADRLPVDTIKQVTFSKDRDIRSYDWKDDGTLIYKKDFLGDENFHLYAVDLMSGDEKDLTPFKDSINEIFSLNTNNPAEILIKSNQRTKKCFDIYKLNIETGAMQAIATNHNGKSVNALADNNGVVRIAIEVDGKICRMYSRASNTTEFKQVLEFGYGNALTPILFSKDNKYFFASSDIGRDKKAIVKIDPNTGRELEEIFSHPEVDVAAIRYSMRRDKLAAVVTHHSRQQFHFFDRELEERIGKIKAKLGDVQIYTGSVNKNEDLWTYITTDDKGWATHLYDALNDRLTQLYSSEHYLPRHKLANKQPISYSARDGTLIHGYLTLPTNSSSKNLPIVVYPHGGPYNVRDTWDYEPVVQFLASRGYGVLQVNFRGSFGYGKNFYNKSFRQFGLAMQDDITDGVQNLIDKGIADKKRVGIFGKSYGGYAALAGAAFTPDLYACAVDFMGPSNLFTFFETMAESWTPLKHIWIERIGDPVKDKALLEAISPLFHVHKIKIPMFIVHGDNDPRVKRSESDQIVAALQKAGVPVEVMFKANEGHGFSNEENLFDFYSKLEQFLDTHLGKVATLENVATNTMSTLSN